MRKLVFIFSCLALIGVAKASNPISGIVAVSTGPMQAYTEAVGRDLEIGDNVYLNDAVETGKATRAQVMLQDESVFSLAPSSKVIFDEFIYDPSEGNGTLEASLISGGMRFVSGRLSGVQPENIKIKAGDATVGIRGTEIMAKHGAEGSTFILLSGEMQISTPGGIQLISRSGFGVDVTPEGLLGEVRQVPLAEINEILSAPAEGESGSGDEASAQGDEGDDASEEESSSSEESESETTSNGSSGEESDEQPDAGSQSAENTSDNPPAPDEGAESESAFDSALTSSVSEGSEADAPTISGIADIAPTEAAETGSPVSTAATASSAQESPPTVDIANDVVSSVVDSLAEDDQQEIATEVNSVLAITLSQNAMSSNPYYSSNAKLLIRADEYFENAASQFGITRDLLREKFPNADGSAITAFDGFDILSSVEWSNEQGSLFTKSNFEEYDAAVLYMDTNNALTAAEISNLSAMIGQNKKVVVIGRPGNNTQVLDSALDIFDGDFSYSVSNVSGSEFSDSASTEAYNSKHHSTLSVAANSDGPLTAGVNSFRGFFEGDRGFPYLQFSNDGTAENQIASNLLELSGDAINLENGSESTLSGGAFSNNGSLGQAMQFGDQGAVFISRYSCGATGSSRGALGSSVSHNFVSDGRLQFCRNLFSSLAPNSSLVDVEVGQLLLAGSTANVSYELNNYNDLFKIVGDKLILKAGTLPTQTQYKLEFTGLFDDGIKRQGDVTVEVNLDTSETRIIAERDEVKISNGSSGSSSASVTIDPVGLQTDLTDVNWITIGSPSIPSETGALILHYRHTENGETFDSFKKVEVNYDCAGEYCSNFSTSLDTETTLEYGTHFNNSDFSRWSSFFERFTTGTAEFHASKTLTTYDISHNLAINFGQKTGTLQTSGTFQNNGETEPFNLAWNNFLFASEKEQVQSVPSTEQFTSESHVGIANIKLPNGKYAIATKAHLIGVSGGQAAHNYLVMKPQ